MNIPTILEVFMDSLGFEPVIICPMIGILLSPGGKFFGRFVDIHNRRLMMIRKHVSQSMFQMCMFFITYVIRALR